MRRIIPHATQTDDFAKAKEYLAGGVDSPVRAGLPVGEPTPFIVSGKGARVFDTEGREYIDYLCAYGPVLLGHGDPRIARAVDSALRKGAVFGATHPEEVRLAERVCARFPSMERVRFVSTGTEACMSAVRVARSVTRREKIIRFAGCYHGHSDEMIFGAGASSLSSATLESGVTSGVVDDVVIVPYNDLPALDLALREHANAVGAIIIEPVAANMGLCLPEPGYLQALRDRTQAVGALLIFDEVITGFRLGPSGAQGRYQIKPDLTCLGKMLGGGLPIAAFGGRADIMAALAPQGPVFVGGTFSGNPTCVAAAHAFLDATESDEKFYVKIEELARRLASGLKTMMTSGGGRYPVVQCASMVDFMFRTGMPHRNMREAKEADAKAYARYYHAMLDQGILLPPSQMELMFLTASHSEADVDATVAATQQALS